MRTGIGKSKDFIYLEKFIWNSFDDKRNREKNEGLSLATGSRIFNDPLLFSVYDFLPEGFLQNGKGFPHGQNSHKDSENPAGKLIGRIGTLYVALVFAESGGFIRIFSCRKADKTEVLLYEQNAKRIQVN